MTEIEYLKAKARMTKKCCIDCTECPLGYDNNGEGCFCIDLEQNHPEKAIEIVERWAKEHPAKTRQSEFLMMFPDSDIDINGNINICPSRVNRQYECSAYDYCDKCRAKFWLEGIE